MTSCSHTLNQAYVEKPIVGGFKTTHQKTSISFQIVNRVLNGGTNNSPLSFKLPAQKTMLFSEWHQTILRASNRSHPPHPLLTPDPSPPVGSEHWPRQNSSRRGNLQLWQFLVSLLDDPTTNGNFISWTGREWNSS
ncbi:ETS translocation variant 1 [Caerostris extrusa]|uniref:ETS translocation variant 1 n=1 Tax=Caerostris extrusa TaxID=172846 RepID=A0AAV4PDS4_CAEEX|nr:ETS translocation variant 1 [Caerostris extrusa]